MKLDDLLNQYPAKRIKPVDGMAVTAAVWDEAHEYHDAYRRFQTLLFQGNGIVSGLQVMASDPPDSSVYILPGVAVDPVGHVIVLSQPVAYDVGNELEGPLFLLISHEESRPRLTARQAQDGTPIYIHSEFSISVRSAVPNFPVVELARFIRSSRKDVFKNAADATRPGANEIDLSKRRELHSFQDASIAVCYLGPEKYLKAGRGAAQLARAINRNGSLHITVQDDAALAPGVESHSLIYLCGSGKFELSAGQVSGLMNYINRGKGTILMENTDAASAASFKKVLTAMNLKPAAVTADHPILTQPHLFPAAPAGAQAGEVQVEQGVVYSTANFGALWQGEASGGAASRELVRSAVEWGENLLVFALTRSQK